MITSAKAEFRFLMRLRALENCFGESTVNHQHDNQSGFACIGEYMRRNR